VFILKTLARELILPPASLLLLILIGALLVWRRRRLGWPVFVAGFAALWLLCTPFVSDRVIALAERCPALNPNEQVNAQAVVVLGGGGQRNYAPEYGGPMAEPVLLERLTLAAYLARHYSLPVAVSSAPLESAAMAATLTRNFEVTPRWIEAHSRDTFENARLSAKLLFPAGVKRIILVTSSMHEWRAAKEFEAAGFEVVPAPAGVSSTREYGIFYLLPSATALQRSYAAAYELIGEPVRRLLAAGSVREKWDRQIGTGT
jgi:uncharacterized SAM-binding protein YcdF (DUF218 family)